MSRPRRPRPNGFHDIILSMKASNPTVMITAYRLLAAHMAAEGMDYPFHLGVTEAGNGEDARIKSAAGTRALPMAGAAARGRAPRPDAVAADVRSEADLERLAALAWRGPGRPRTALLARGSDPALLARALDA